MWKLIDSEDTISLFFIITVADDGDNDVYAIVRS